MHAMLLEGPGQPLVRRRLPRPAPGPGQVLVKVTACGVCRTDLHVVDGDLSEPKLPIVPGHEIVGRVLQLGPGVDGLTVGARVGIPWLGYTCGHCAPLSRGTGKSLPIRALHRLSDRRRLRRMRPGRGRLLLSPAGADQRCRSGAAPVRRADRLPVLGQGRRGPADRALRLRRGGPHRRPGGAATRAARSMPSPAPATQAAQDFARGLGAVWAGPSNAAPPSALDAAILFAPVGALVPAALARPCGRAGASSAPAST